jgi:hypothetical protein
MTSSASTCGPSLARPSLEPSTSPAARRWRPDNGTSFIGVGNHTFLTSCNARTRALAFPSPRAAAPDASLAICETGPRATRRHR